MVEERKDERGVPARFGHSEPSGPPGSQSSRNREKTPAPPSAAPRIARSCGQPSSTRERTAISTAARHSTLRIISHALFTSLPVPKPCSSAIGQLA